MKFKLLHFPESDRVTNCIDTFLNVGMNDTERQYEYIEHCLVGLINYYNQFTDDPYANDISLDLTKMLAVLQEFHAKE